MSNDLAYDESVVKNLKEEENVLEYCNHVYAEHTIKEEPVEADENRNHPHSDVQAGSSADPDFICEDEPLHKRIKTEIEETDSKVGILYCKCDSSSLSPHNDTNLHRRTINSENQNNNDDQKYHCLKCKYIAKSSLLFELHQRVHSTKMPYKCRECPYNTSKAGSFNKHILTHNKEEFYTCPFCVSRFRRMASLQKHIDSKHPENEGDFEKPTGSMIQEKEDLDSISTEDGETNVVKSAHLTSQDKGVSDPRVVFNRNNGITILKCEGCNFIATNARSIELHKIIHTSKAPWVCAACDHATSNSCHFNYHILHCQDDKPYSCEYCDRNFSTPSERSRHVHQKHGDVIITCEYCKFTAASQTTMDKHKEEHHIRFVGWTSQDFMIHGLTTKAYKNVTKYSTKITSYQSKNGILECNQCNFISTKSQSLKEHQCIHKTNTPYQCELCKFQTSNTSHFNDHVLAHNKDKPYHCPHCFKSFSRARYLQTHMNKQHIDSLIHCSLCDYTAFLPAIVDKHIEQCHVKKAGPDIQECTKCEFIFTKSLSLELHQIVHDTEAPYRCPECEYQAHLISEFNVHVLAHNHDKPFSCPHCLGQFYRAGKLNAHVACRHNYSKPETNSATNSETKSVSNSETNVIVIND